MGKDSNLVEEVTDKVASHLHIHHADGKPHQQQQPSKDAIIATLLEETRSLRNAVTKLSQQVDYDKNAALTYYASDLSTRSNQQYLEIPAKGLPAKFVAELIENVHLNDFNPRLNTSSYVNVVSEEEERRVAAIGAEIK